MHCVALRVILCKAALRLSASTGTTVNKFLPYMLLGLGVASTCLAGAQSWTAVSNVPNIGANNPLLLTDGTVLIQDGDTPNWYKLTPDINGNYATGTWKQVASMPSSWGPLYFGSEVMPDGRVFAVGGEYNNGPAVWTNKAGVYDPVANVWTPVTVPAPWQGMGDTATAVLPNGLVYVADPLSNETAAFNPATNQFIYPYGGFAKEYNDEAGLTLLPNGNLFRTDCWSSASAEIFNTTTLQWQTLPPMPYNVLDIPDSEMGPAILQYNGTVMQFGGNGSNIEYDPAHNKWIAEPSFPNATAGQVDLADGGAVLLPNGNILVDAGIGYFASSALFYLWNGSTLTAVPGTPDANQVPGGYGNFLLLPNGQALHTDLTSNVYVYSPGGAPNPAWAPTITTVPQQLHISKSYTISGTQFNGLSQGAAYGDDSQSNTNYPIIKITSTQTGHVFYAKEYSPSTMAICTGSQIVSTHFTVPSNTELGAATIQVVANGIASAPVSVVVQPELLPYYVNLYQPKGGQGTNFIGDVPSVSLLDNVFCYATSQLLAQPNVPTEQVCSILAKFNVGQGVTHVKPFVAGIAPSSVTEQLYIYDWKTKQYVYVTQTPFTSADTQLTGTPPGNGSDYVSPSGEVDVVVRGLRPTHLTPLTFTIAIDVISLQFG